MRHVIPFDHDYAISELSPHAQIMQQASRAIHHLLALTFMIKLSFCSIV